MIAALIIIGIITIIMSVIGGISTGAILGFFLWVIGGVSTAMVFFSLSVILENQAYIISQLHQNYGSNKKPLPKNKTCSNCEYTYNEKLRSCPNCGRRE